MADEIKAKGGTAAANYSSVTDFKAAEGIINNCVEKFGKIDILVNLAGILRERMVWNLTEEDWDLVLSTHLKGTFNCCKYAAGVMRKQRSGRIINITSEAWRELPARPTTLRPREELSVLPNLLPKSWAVTA